MSFGQNIYILGNLGYCYFHQKSYSSGNENVPRQQNKMLRHVSEFNLMQITRLFFGSQRFKTGNNDSPLLKFLLLPEK